MSRMTYMRSWKSQRLPSHTWLGLSPQIGRPLSRIVGAIGLLFFFLFLDSEHESIFVVSNFFCRVIEAFCGHHKPL
jgi:hypothetical protein